MPTTSQADHSQIWAPQTWPDFAASRTLRGMHQRCEVCENFRPEGDLKPGRTLEAVKYGARLVLLCRAHAGIAQSSGATRFEALRELYTESDGLRSYVPRRARLTSDPSRALSAKPRSAGRRASDAP